MRDRWLRRGLIVLAAPQLVIGIWILADPHGWFAGFPGAGHAWVAPLGPYDEHLVWDVGAAFLGFGVLLARAAARPATVLVRAALLGWLAFVVPHFLYHLVTEGRLPAADTTANLLGLGFEALLPLPLLWLTFRPAAGPRPWRATPATADDGAPTLGRIPGVPAKQAGLPTRFGYWMARRRVGQVLEPMKVMAHQPQVLRTAGWFELGLARWNTVDARLKALASLKAGARVGCPW